MSDVNQDMIGTRNQHGRVYPKVTIAGRRFTKPAVTVRLDESHFCVDDNTLPRDERTARIDALKALVAKPSRSKKVESTEDGV